jgi:hypothetical protein
MSNRQTVTFQEALEIVEALPEGQQDDLVDIVRSRRIERRRELLAESMRQARAEHSRGETRRGNADDLMKELAE